MPKSSCRVCGKPLPEEIVGSRCRLCSIGLTPAAPGELRFSHDSGGDPASGRVLSGTHCPDCRAELSLADISLKRCGICGKFISLETLNQNIQVRQTRLPTFRPTDQINQS